MNEIADILHTVLSTELLAPSIGRLAETLGYQGRTTLYRLRDGEASDKAISEFCKRLSDKLFVSDDSLREMAVTISNTSQFSAMMRREMNTSHKEWQLQVLLAFVSKNFQYFSPGFRNGDLGMLMKLEMEDSDAFYCMLAYFYVKSTNFDFYDKSLTHRQQSAALIEPVGEWFMDIYPENSVAERMTHLYSASEIYNAEGSMLWNAVKSLAIVLESFANPDIFRKAVSKLYQLPGIGERSYWRGNTDENIVTLMWLNKGELPGSGYYEVFHVDRRDGSCRNVCRLSIMSDEILSVVDVVETNSKLGCYTFDGEVMTFCWERDNDDATHSGNRWQLLPLKNSASLRAIDRALSDEALIRAALLAEGSELAEEMEIDDVVVSKLQVKICLKNNTTYVIDREDASFLMQVTPDMPISIYRRVADGELFVAWLTLKQTIPLSWFETAE